MHNLRKFNINKQKCISFLSLLYTSFLIIGNSYSQKGNISLIIKHPVLTSLLAIFLFFLFRFIIIKLFSFIDKYNFTSTQNNLLQRHPFFISFIIIILGWLIYIIAFYPVILSPDPSYQIKQYFHIPNKYLDYAVMIDPKVTITNHHPVIHTILLGSLLQLGNILGSDNLGLFFYSFLQIIILASTLATTIWYLNKQKISHKYLYIILCIYSFVPMFPFYAMSAIKDVIFSCLIILFIILIHHLLNKKLTLKQNLLFFLLIVLIMLFRHNGFHVVCLTILFLIIINKINRQNLLISFLLFLIFNYSYNNLILPAFKITGGSIRESLSIPFQQTARYVSYFENLPKKEYIVYDKLLDMSDLAKRYDPEISDPVKNKYNKYASKNDLKNYFKYWFKGFFKAPNIYIDATINNTYGYIYPLKLNWYIYYKYDTRIVGDGFKYSYNNLSMLREILSNIGKVFPYLPVLGLISNIGFNTWIIFFLITYLVEKKYYSKLAILLPSFIIFLVCLASPVNTYFRYAMPYIFAMPLIIGLILVIEK